MANLVVPKGILLSRNPFEAGLEIETASRPIDHVQRSADGELRRRGRGATINMGALARTRETGQQFPSANTMPIAARSPASRVTEDSVDPLQMPSPTTARKTSLYSLYEKAKYKQERIRRSPWVQTLFEYSIYVLIVAFIYLVLVGLPLWKGAVYWLYWVVDHKFVISGGFAITVRLAAIYAFLPPFVFFDKDPLPVPTTTGDPPPTDVALLIPCYKSGKIIGATLEAALKIFPRQNIFVIANGNSPTPLDNTGDVCASYGVSHTWSPLGSEIIAQFVGCHVSKRFPHILLIDDDCLLPPTFPLGTEKFSERIKCIGYTITSVGPNCSKGTLVQQAQDLEYKLSGLQRQFSGLVGSATLPHGAISMWDREFLLQTTLGSRIVMNSEVFVETETRAAIFWSGGGGERGGFGEMTVWKQRFERWNFFFVNGLYWNMRYIPFSWKLGFWEIGAKIFVFQEVYETLLHLLTPFVLPISFVVRPAFCGYLLAGTLVLYFANTLIFNLIHLRRKVKVRPDGTITTQALSTKALCFYLPYKCVLTVVNVASCYWSIFMCARYFAKRHPKVVEDSKVVEVVLNLDGNLKENGLCKCPTLPSSMNVDQ
ncbi:uncharacterized protein LY89DRAFT_707002 [Mollisia scopiformis]|uniref:Uncharacterized protein n=1 Tax=Mollisia scopiformis TaxID=149040 RepID=A0A194XB79_MOLSC|nr:uncharacterized protein LY89DRAFT_707002 [Mollisia scopiformis]KUJ17423.1 hypothetical protein LY89DRAFT_707002 [Mollisia scopiformis]